MTPLDPDPLDVTHPWPRPEDFDRMSRQEFEAYTKRIGFDDRIKAALAEPIRDDTAGLIVHPPHRYYRGRVLVAIAAACALIAFVGGFAVGRVWP